MYCDNLLLDCLKASAPSRIITVSSKLHKGGDIDFDSFRGFEKYNAQAAYNQSKLAIMLLARELAERLADKQITVNTLHPGAVNTGILDGYSKFAQFFLRMIFIAPEKGARTSLFLVGSDPAELPKGKYFVGRKESATHKLVDGNYNNKRYVSLFAGLAPISDPRFVMVVSIDDPRGKLYYGGDVAAPVFSDLMQDLMRLYNVRPDNLDDTQVTGVGGREKSA